jgi:hypothetical protein
MPYGYDPILTSFTSITTSSSDCSGARTKRIYQGLWRMSDVDGRAYIAADMGAGLGLNKSCADSR